MIEKLVIKGFQAHERFALELSPGVTTIVGSSDVGKSALLRALRWVGFNRPSGSAFVRRGSGACSVKVVIDGRTVKRIKTPSSNTYELDGVSFRSFGSNVPDPVAAVLNVREINFQRQHDGPFWLGLSGGEVGRALNAVVDLSQIDESLARANSEARKTEAAIEVRRLQLREAEEAVETTVWVEEASRTWQAVQDLGERVEQVRERSRLLGEVLGNCNEATSSLAEVAEQRRDLSAVIESAARVVKVGEKLDRIKGLLESARKLEGKLCQTIERSRAARVRLAAVKSCPLCRRPLKGQKLSPC